MGVSETIIGCQEMSIIIVLWTFGLYSYWNNNSMLLEIAVVTYYPEYKCAWTSNYFMLTSTLSLLIYMRLFYTYHWQRYSFIFGIEYPLSNNSSQQYLYIYLEAPYHRCLSRPQSVPRWGINLYARRFVYCCVSPLLTVSLMCVIRVLSSLW